MNMPLNTSANISDPIEQARYNMIEQQIRPWNVLDADVLELLAVVHREDFVPPACRSMAFMDIEIPLLGTDAEEAVHEYGVKLELWDDLPRADAIVAAVAHREYQSLSIEDLGRKMIKGGAFIDVKAAFDAGLLRESGFRVWRL